MRTRRLGWVLALVIIGCIPETHLQPRPDARSLKSDPSAAIAETHGVRLVADGVAWQGYPSDLERRLTPVRIWVENHSGRTLSIRDTFFNLLGESRFRYAALSAQKMEEVDDAQPRCVAGYAPSYWSVGLSWGWGGYHGYPLYPWSPWVPGPYYYPFADPFYGPSPYMYCDEPLPTQDMVKQALPEGTLENGGTVAGFLYFQDVGERERQVLLQARLVDASTGQPFGQLTIPFEVRKN
jgi:hypothetical protein